MEDHTRDNVIEGLIAAGKSMASIIPGPVQAIAAWDAIGRKELDRNFELSIHELNQKVGALSVFFKLNGSKRRRVENARGGELFLVRPEPMVAAYNALSALLI